MDNHVSGQTHMTTTSTNIEYHIELTKKQIIQRLFEAGHITFNEMWTLLLEDPEVRYIPMPYQVQQDPIITPFNPWTVCKHDNSH